MVIDLVRLPTDVERGVKGGPLFSTMVMKTDGGSLTTNQNWQYPLYQGQVGYGVSSKAEMRSVMNFFYARRGQARGFLFRDWSDYEFTGETLGAGDGAITDFQLVRLYPDSALPFTRPIKHPIEGTIIITDNDVTVSPIAYSITAGGIIHFSVAPVLGHVIKVVSGGQFDIAVHFASDKLDIDMEVFNVGSIPNIPIEEVRE